MTKLNYEAKLEVDPGSPFSVNSGAAKNPPGDYKYKDFVPKVQTTTKLKKGLNDAMRRPAARYEKDYISGDDSAVRRNSEKSKIIELAKQIFNDSRKRKEEYDKAKAIIETAKESDFGNPSPELARAIRVKNKLKPISKEEALEQAEKVFYGGVE